MFNKIVVTCFLLQSHVSFLCFNIADDCDIDLAHDITGAPVVVDTDENAISAMNFELVVNEVEEGFLPDMEYESKYIICLSCITTSFKGEASPSIYADWVNGGWF